MKHIGYFCGYRIMIVETVFSPKLVLSDTLMVSDEFRKEFDQWLLDQFGAEDCTPIPKEQAVISEEHSVMYIREDDWPVLRARMEAIDKEGLQL